MVREILEQEMAGFSGGRFDEARALFEEVALSDEYVEFLTLPAYSHLD
jgi:malate synthase